MKRNGFELKRITHYAMEIETETHVYVGSYKTLVCSLDKRTGEITRYWDDWSISTMGHIRRTACACVGYKDTWLSMPVKTRLNDEEKRVADTFEEFGYESPRSDYLIYAFNRPSIVWGW